MSAALLKKMRDMGLTMEQAIELMETIEEGMAKPVPELSPGALRTRKWRANQAAKEEVASPRDVTETVTETRHGDVSHVGERTQVVKPSSSLRSEDVVVVAERASAPQTDDWPKGNGPHLAKLLVAEVDSHWLDLARSAGLNTSTGRFLAWKREGASWVHDVVPVITAVCAKRKSRVNSWQFFDEAIAASIAANRAALEIPEAGQVIPLRPGGAAAITDRIAAENAEARRRAFAMLEARNGQSS